MQLDRFVSHVSRLRGHAKWRKEIKETWKTWTQRAYEIPY